MVLFELFSKIGVTLSLILLKNHLKKAKPFSDTVVFGKTLLKLNWIVCECGIIYSHGLVHIWCTSENL